MEALLMIPVLLLAIISHEVAHGYAAYLCGDPTAKQLGRLTFNPLPHIDPVGSVVFPLVLLLTHAPILFGWAKPVPINPACFRNPKRHHLYVSLAGVAANLVLAILSTVLYGVYVNCIQPSSGDALLVMLRFGITINVILAVFNLLPIPPLDGSWVLYHLLPPAAAAQYRKLFPYGFVILIILLLTNVVHSIIIPVYSVVISLLQGLLHTIIM